MRALKRFGLFWVDFIVGDDWTLAVVVVIALAVTWALSRAGFPGWVAMVAIILAALVTSVGRARRAAARRRQDG
jgi:Flp pilus assembly protein TadB